jgi:hypothetical protein
MIGMETGLRRARFKLETFPEEYFDGYTKGEEWNGWACPYFSFETAKEIIESHNSFLNSRAWYDENEDKFVVQFPAETEEYYPIVANGEKLYPIGSMAWIWEEA